MTGDDSYCLCGAVRYRARAGPVDAGYCHCMNCRRSNGAPVAAWASFLVKDFSYENADPTLYESSARGQREFCDRCGTQIAYRLIDGATKVDVNICSLDDPTSVWPRRHVWTESRLPWFDTDDGLPCCRRGQGS